MSRSAAAHRPLAMGPDRADFTSFDFLVVEDNEFLSRLITEILHSFGAGRIRQVQTAEGALQEIAVHAPDIIFCDWVLPDSSGLMLLRALRRDNNGRYPRMPVIVVSGHATDDHVAQAIGEGADSYVVKPFSARTLMQHILKVVTRQEGVLYLG
ncbi:MAG: response regulator [Alphaproteobacteria bacterium]|nr:response regulator [Alphaproteobacteria bacterium]